MLDLEAEIRAVMQIPEKAMTVDQVVEEIAKKITPEVREILNSLVKRDLLKSTHGGGPYQTQYMAPPIARRI